MPSTSSRRCWRGHPRRSRARPRRSSAEPARMDTWQPQISGIGTLTAFQGIDITPQVGGIVDRDQFRIRARTSRRASCWSSSTPRPKKPTCAASRPNSPTTETELTRREELADKGMVARTELDTLKTRKRVLQATLDRRRPTWRRSSSMRRGTAASASRTSPLGSYLAPGQKIVWLQKIDPIFADFTVTEAELRPDPRGPEGDGDLQRLSWRKLHRQRSPPPMRAFRTTAA